MKIKNILTLSIALVVTLTMTSCFEEMDLSGGSVQPVSLTIMVDDGEKAVSEATVDLYATLDDYISEVNAVASATTDVNGMVMFDASSLGSVATKFYFNVASGSQRNWNFVSSTAVMNMTNGATTVGTSVGDLPPGFVYLTSNQFSLTAYSYSGSGYVLEDNVLPGCEINDIVEFKKDGSVWRFDGTNACNPPSDFQLPLFDVDGSAWSTWGLSADGSELNVRDFDPYWDSSNIEVTGGVLVDEVAGTVTVAYGGPYNALLLKL